MIPELLAEARKKMDLAVDHVGAEFTTVRTGRANPQILHRVQVEYYGTPTNLQQLASFSDRSSMTAIEKAIKASDLGLNPSNDGNVIRLSFPPLTEERRRDLIKMVKHMAEEGRVAVRSVRRHAKEEMEALHGEVSDDDIRRGEKDLQELTDRHVQKIDDLLSNKETELLEV
jgi:ribosome recycling factor